MTILELTHDNKYKQYNAVVKLSYDEIRDLSHGMYQLCKDERNKLNVSYHETHKEIALLFDLVKNGHLDSWSVSMLNDLQKAIDEYRERIKNSSGVEAE
jgi:hypothetical protein